LEFGFNPNRIIKIFFETQKFSITRTALGGAAVILFERYEQKDKSGSADLALRIGNAQILRVIFVKIYLSFRIVGPF
jgi:hypothetical protein